MLREITVDDLEKILRWRNSPDVRNVMFSDHLISKEEHLVWWENSRENLTKKNLMFVCDSQDVGVVNFFDIESSGDECHWGFYLSSDLNDQLHKMKIWQQLEKEAIEYAFSTISCKQLLCESFYFNKPVIEMHKRFGFVEVSVESREKSGKVEKVSVTRLGADVFHKNNFKKHIRATPKIVLLGSSNLDFISAELVQSGLEYDITFDVLEVPYGQYELQLNDEESLLRKANFDYIVFIERIEDFVKINDVFSDEVLTRLMQRWSEYLERIRKARDSLKGSFFICNPVGLNSWITSIAPNGKESKSIYGVFDQMKGELYKLCEEIPDTHLVDLDGLVRHIGRAQSHPGKYWYLARAPFSAKFNKRLSQHLLGMIMSIEALTARVIVIDLDNTLWGGVIGDDGLSGISIGGDFPGNVYQVIQRIFLSFQKRGVALVLCSKNTEEIALEVFHKHPEMLMKKEDFTTWRINWRPKPENIREIASELGLGLASLCFIDDNSVEREEVRASLPEVFVPELPEDISEWPEFIINLPELSSIDLTDEDRKRTSQYKIRSMINDNEKHPSSREDFLKTLSMKLFFEHYNEKNQQRVLQLIQKTNQFNTTTKRYKEQELEAVLKNGECIAVRLKDKMGSDEIIGVLMISYENKNARIDLLLLSCRVLGRGVETAMLAWLASYLKERSFEKIFGEIVVTERNQPVLDIYINHSFNEVSKNMYELDILNMGLNMPDWINVG